MGRGAGSKTPPQLQPAPQPHRAVGPESNIKTVFRGPTGPACTRSLAQSTHENGSSYAIMQPSRVHQAPSHQCIAKTESCPPQTRLLAGGPRQAANDSTSSPGRLAPANEGPPTSSPGAYSIQLLQPEGRIVVEPLHVEGLVMRPDWIRQRLVAE